MHRNPALTTRVYTHSNPCAAGIMSQFIANPSAKLDTGCVGADPFGFILPDGTPSVE